jgi:hypothetical protein
MLEPCHALELALDLATGAPMDVLAAGAPMMVVPAKKKPAHGHHARAVVTI